jgi:ATP-dependent RNA helicase DHX33
MAAFPLEPQYAAILLASTKNHCTSEIVSILSVLSASSPLLPDSTAQREAAASARAKFRHATGDHLTILNVVRAFDEVRASESKGGRREWCKTNFVNERALREAGDIREQLKRVCERESIDWRASCAGEDGPVLRSLVSGLVLHAAFLQPDGSYKQAMGPSVKFHLRLFAC